MSQENVEIIRAGFDAWNARDMEALGKALHPEVILRTPEGWPEPGPYVGREAVLRQFDQNRETWSSDRFELVTEFLDAADRVVVRAVWHGVGSGPDSGMEFTHVYTLRKGKVVFVEYFWDHAEALETMGLPRES